jgi:hypothetical protein
MVGVSTDHSSFKAATLAGSTGRAADIWSALRSAGTVLRLVASDRRVPRPVKWTLAFAVLPIPGPVDEIVGGLAVYWLVRRRPAVLREYWRALHRQDDAAGTADHAGSDDGRERRPSSRGAHSS